MGRMSNPVFLIIKKIPGTVVFREKYLSLISVNGAAPAVGDQFFGKMHDSSANRADYQRSLSFDIVDFLAAYSHIATAIFAGDFYEVTFINIFHLCISYCYQAISISGKSRKK